MENSAPPSSYDDPNRSAAEAFTRKAALYDAFGENHPNLSRMRRRVREHVLRYVEPGAEMLELNAGTGADAVYFAERGIRVLATDISPGMLAAVREKVAENGLESRLKVQECSFTELDDLDQGPFDHVFSNMGGLNCIPDLAAVTRHLPRLLKPGGSVTFVVMPHICPWEWLAVLKGDRHTAFRRFKREGTLANVEGVPVRTYYFSASRVQSVFGPEFSAVRLENLSLLTPPADHKGFAHRVPRVYRLLAWLDDRLSSVPVLRGWGDFFILTMGYQP